MDCGHCTRIVPIGHVVFAGLFAALLTGCAAQRESLYYWGDFPAQQYAYFQGEKGPEEGIQVLEKTREEAKAQNKALPPGLQAHLGLLYGQTGRIDLLEQYLEAERQQFPESAVYVDFLLKKNRQEKSAQERVQERVQESAENTHGKDRTTGQKDKPQ